MATFLRQSDCAGEPHANPNRLRDPDKFSFVIRYFKNPVQNIDPAWAGFYKNGL
jgi:hypothetical protein